MGRDCVRLSISTADVFFAPNRRKYDYDRPCLQKRDGRRDGTMDEGEGKVRDGDEISSGRVWLNHCVNGVHEIKLDRRRAAPRSRKYDPRMLPVLLLPSRARQF